MGTDVASWDVFHSERLEVERGLSTDEVRAALGRGDLRDDDLARPAGTTDPWARIADLPALLEPGPEAVPALPGGGHDPDTESFADVFAPFSDSLNPPPAPTAPPPEPVLTALIDDEDEDDEDIDLSARFGPILDEFRSGADHIAAEPPPLPGDLDMPSIDLGEDEDEGEGADEYDPQDEDEAAAEFTLSRGAPEKVEELDLAAMVDVAFQLVLFFLVTATTVLYKTLEVPKPNPEQAPGATLQGQGRTLEDLQRDYILVEIDPAGAVKVDHEPAPSEMQALAERLRAARQSTGRTAMLLTADAATLHRSAVTAYDAANEIGLRIAIANPRPRGAAPPPPAP